MTFGWSCNNIHSYAKKPILGLQQKKRNPKAILTHLWRTKNNGKYAFGIDF